MRFEGVLSAWNPDAGHGRIRPVGGGVELFVSLAAFPTDGEGPRLDQRLSFEIVTARDGSKQAVNLQRLAAPQPRLREAIGIGSERVRQAQRKRRLTLWGGAVVVLLFAGGGLVWLQPWHKAGEVPPALRR